MSVMKNNTKPNSEGIRDGEFGTSGRAASEGLTKEVTFE